MIPTSKAKITHLTDVCKWLQSRCVPCSLPRRGRNRRLPDLNFLKEDPVWIVFPTFAPLNKNCKTTMRHTAIHKPSIRFRRWSRKSYATFVSIGRCVTIGTLGKNVVEKSLCKQKGSIRPMGGQPAGKDAFADGPCLPGAAAGPDTACMQPALACLCMALPQACPLPDHSMIYHPCYTATNTDCRPHTTGPTSPCSLHIWHSQTI